MTPPLTPGLVAQDEITVKINNVEYKVPSTFSEVSLNEYLRTHLHLTGTKVMCREGGCGACIVHVAYPDPAKPGSGEMIQHSVNSCLCPILSCDKWEITTVEGVGSQEKPHPIQSKLVEHYGTQCGYCSPGMVMSMYSLLQTTSQNELTKQQVEDWFGGNICRCTGYRPILEAFRTFAGADQDSKCNLTDLEDIGKVVCKKTGNLCGGTCKDAENLHVVQRLPKAVSDNAPSWFKPTTMAELYELIDKHTDHNPYYVVGHTGVGVYNDAPYQAGSWGGNLAMKNLHKDMPSDSFVGFAASDARIVVGQKGQETSYNMTDFLALDLKGKIILRVEFQPKTSTTKFRTFKIMPRSQNSHSIVHSAFIIDIAQSKEEEKCKCTKALSNLVSKSQSEKPLHRVVFKGQPAIAFGNISHTFVRATQTENFLANKDLGDVGVLQQALKILHDEIQPDDNQLEALPEVKKSLAVSLFYKFALELVGDAADARYRSAVGPLIRPISSGKQDFQTKRENWPLTQPIPKLESLAQCSGEAKYISDIDQEGMLHAAFAITTRGNATIYKMDLTNAMNLPGVVKILTAEDIPGSNDITAPLFGGKAEEPEPLLATTRANYAGQPVAIVVAVTRNIAEAAAKLVTCMYSNEEKTVATSEQAFNQKSFYKKVPDYVRGDAVAEIAKAPRKVAGEFSIGTQIHFHMETQVAVTYPVEDGLNVEAGTQWLDGIQSVVSRIVRVPQNTVFVNCKRNGGGFGAKIQRNNSIAAASALAAHILKRPVKMHMSFWDNSKIIGKRWSWYVKYEAGFDDSGKVAGINMDMYINIGSYADSSILMGAALFIDNVYHCPAWKLSATPCKTHIPNNTAARSPASTEMIFFIENLFEHIASSLGKPAIEIKRLNFLQNGDTLLVGSALKDFTMAPILEQLLASSEHTTRMQAVNDFNRANRWKKRGLAVVPMRFPCHWAGSKFAVYIAIFHNGGTVSVSHGGIEIGQGINTKIAQVVAFELKIDMKLIKIESTNSFVSANGGVTGGSVTSELCCLAAIDACDQLKKRMENVRAKTPGAKWEELVETCFAQGVDLSAHGWVAHPFTLTEEYNTYGAMCTEVEVDTLTGEYQTTRMDILYDCGESMSPLIDMGQVEGGVVMGLGYYTSEEVIYDEITAENLTYDTWTYKPPGAKDIPVDMRITLLPNAPNPRGVLRSKIVAEPPLCMTCSVVFALRNAIVACRIDNGKGGEWFRLDTPLTPARVLEYCMADIGLLKYKD